MLAVAVLAQKGGVGKTTVALGLAVEGERRGLPAVVLDLDPQGSAAKWGDTREESSPVVTAAQASRLQKVLLAAAQGGAGVVVIDTAPFATDAALAAAKEADLVVVPCRPSAFDLAAIAATVDIAALARKQAVVVLNGAPVNNPIVGQARDALAGYEGVATCPIALHHRIDHVHAAGVGQVATEWAPGGKAAGELRALAEWIYGKAAEGGLGRGGETRGRTQDGS